jgi:hypothetical protein
MEENGPGMTRRKWLYVAFASVTAWALAGGFFLIFSYFPPYDDEGYLMMTVKQMLGGGVLYDEIYTQYGPAYYIYRWLLSGLLGLPVTHDATRLGTLVVWVLTSLGSGVLAYRFTRSTLFAGAAYILTVVGLSRTVYEPGHPQDICGLIVIAGLLTLAVRGENTVSGVRLGLLAGLVAVLCLIKINLGLLFGLAVAIALLGASRFSFGRALQAVLVLAAAVLPFVLFRNYLGEGWLRLSVAVAIGVASAWAIGRGTQARAEEITLRKMFLMAGCFTATLAAILLVMVAGGSSLSAIADGVLFQHLKFGDDFYQPAPVQRFAAYWACLSLLTAAAFLWLKYRWPAIAERASTVLKIGFGIAIIGCSLAGYTYYLNHFVLISFATPFLWIFLTGGPPDAKGQVIARTSLVFTATLMTLQIFPIAGTQLAYGTFLMILIGVVSLHDGLSRVPSVHDLRFGRRVRIASTAIAAITLAGFCIYWARENAVRYYSQTPLDLPGASLVRLPAKDAELYNYLVANLNDKCDSFVTMPGFYSLYFWTRKDPPTALNATAWMSLLSDSQQAAIVEKIRPVPRLCAVYHPQQTRNGSRNRDLSEMPLSAFIFENMQTESSLDEYQFMIRK